ncbi:MAG: hypothetical protein M3302_01885 [Actinomycetota bacterium]|nr:hypothetical protein [Actinomycetota bacterium]
MESAATGPVRHPNIASGAVVTVYSNYTGDCVPIARDVDCEADTGNGPAYVGDDRYELDRDGNGVGCET